MHSQRSPILADCTRAAPKRVPRRTLLLLALSSLGLSACGFALRRNVIPAEYTNKSLRAGFAPESTLGIQFASAYLTSGGKLAAPNSTPDLILRVLVEERKRIPLSTTIGGLVREYRLDLSLTVELSNAQGDTIMPPSTFKQQRLLSFSESEALAKEYETTQSYREMEQDLIQVLLNRFNALAF